MTHLVYLILSLLLLKKLHSTNASDDLKCYNCLSVSDDGKNTTEKCFDDFKSLASNFENRTQLAFRYDLGAAAKPDLCIKMATKLNIHHGQHTVVLKMGIQSDKSGDLKGKHLNGTELPLTFMTKNGNHEEINLSVKVWGCHTKDCNNQENLAGNLTKNLSLLTLALSLRYYFSSVLLG